MDGAASCFVSWRWIERRHSLMRFYASLAQLRIEERYNLDAAAAGTRFVCTPHTLRCQVHTVLTGIARSIQVVVVVVVVVVVLYL